MSKSPNTFLSHPLFNCLRKIPLKHNLKSVEKSTLLQNVETFKTIKMVDDSGDPLLEVDVKDNEIELTLYKPIAINTVGDFNWVNKKGNIYIESHKGNLHLNSRLAKQIKNLPESIKFRCSQLIKTLVAKDGYQPEILSRHDKATPPTEE